MRFKKACKFYFVYLQLRNILEKKLFLFYLAETVSSFDQTTPLNIMSKVYFIWRDFKLVIRTKTKFAKCRKLPSILS